MLVSLDEAGGVYFISFPGCSDFVKIGYAVCFSKRFDKLQTSSPHPLSVELIFPVSSFDRSSLSYVERMFHSKFASYRYRGEWFVRSGDLASFIAKKQKLEPKSTTTYSVEDGSDACFGWDLSGIDMERMEVRGFNPITSLSNRENEVLKALCEGMSNKAIAERLSLSTETIKSHVSSIILKTNSNDRLGCVIKAIRAGY